MMTFDDYLDANESMLRITFDRWKLLRSAMSFLEYAEQRYDEYLQDFAESSL